MHALPNPSGYKEEKACTKKRPGNLKDEDERNPIPEDVMDVPRPRQPQARRGAKVHGDEGADGGHEADGDQPLVADAHKGSPTEPSRALLSVLRGV